MYIYYAVNIPKKKILSKPNTIYIYTVANNDKWDSI